MAYPPRPETKTRAAHSGVTETYLPEINGVAMPWGLVKGLLPRGHHYNGAARHYRMKSHAYSLQ